MGKRSKFCNVSVQSALDCLLQNYVKHTEVWKYGSFWLLPLPHLFCLSWNFNWVSKKVFNQVNPVSLLNMCWMLKYWEESFDTVTRKPWWKSDATINISFRGLFLQQEFCSIFWRKTSSDCPYICNAWDQLLIPTAMSFTESSPTNK